MRALVIIIIITTTSTTINLCTLLSAKEIRVWLVTLLNYNLLHQ